MPRPWTAIAVGIVAAAGVVALSVTATLTYVARADGKRPGAVEVGEYAGADACKKCHFKDHRDWKKTKHAAAFESLPAKYRGDAGCLACHTTGHGQPGGFVSIAATPKLAGVQCEMCHGPGAAHAKFLDANEERLEDDAVVAEGRRLIGAERGKSVCWRCHLDQTHGQHPEFEK